MTLYANSRTPRKNDYIDETNKLFLGLKLNSNKNLYSIAGDFNARYTILGDRSTNRHGSYLMEWNNKNTLLYKTKMYPPDSPTYTPASTFLDICIADYIGWN